MPIPYLSLSHRRSLLPEGSLLQPSQVPGFAVNETANNPTEEVVPEENKFKGKLRSSTKKHRKK
jgi:hypothetical protein